MGTNEVDAVDLADGLGNATSRLYTLLRRSLLGEDLGLARIRVLSLLHDLGPMRITQLATLDQVSQPTLTVMIDGLEDRGLVVRERDAADRRAVVVALSDAGRAEIIRVRLVRSQSLALRLGRLDADQRSAIADALPAIEQLLALGPD